MTTIQDRIIKANISIQKSAYEMANARDKAFKVGEIKDGKTTDEWKEYRKSKVKLSNTISTQLDKLEEEVRKECIEKITNSIMERRKHVNIFNGETADKFVEDILNILKKETNNE